MPKNFEEKRIKYNSKVHAKHSSNLNLILILRRLSTNVAADALCRRRRILHHFIVGGIFISLLNVGNTWFPWSSRQI